MKRAPLPRREFLRLGAGVALATHVATRATAASAAASDFRLRYVLSTNQYGTLPIADIVPQVHAAGCEGLDIWAGRWGNQREQIDALGHEKFAALLEKHRARVSCYTCMDPGFLKAEPHMRAMRKFGSWTSIFMHATPRGAPLHSTVQEVTAALNRARSFLDAELARA